MRTSPYPIKHSVRFVERTHRRPPHAHDRMWAIALWVESSLRGVALVGRPKARKLGVDQGSAAWPPPYDRLEVVRVAVEEGVPNGCSMLYGACSRTARAMGALDLLTYTDEDEPGTSLRAAGWIPDDGLYGGGQADRPSRPRRRRTQAEAQRRRRWWAPWSKSAPKRERGEQMLAGGGTTPSTPPLTPPSPDEHRGYLEPPFVAPPTPTVCEACNGVGFYVSLPGDAISPCPYCSEKDSTRLTAEAVDGGAKDSTPIGGDRERG
jgi:hypothetical protein